MKLIEIAVVIIVAFVLLSTAVGLGTLFFGGPCPQNLMCFNPFTGQKVYR